MQRDGIYFFYSSFITIVFFFRRRSIRGGSSENSSRTFGRGRISRADTRRFVYSKFSGENMLSQMNARDATRDRALQEVQVN